METMQTATVKMAKMFASIGTEIVIGVPLFLSNKFTKAKSNDFGDLGVLEYIVACDGSHTAINIKPDNLFGIIGIVSETFRVDAKTIQLSDGPVNWWTVNSKLTVILHNGVITIVQYL